MKAKLSACKSADSLNEIINSPTNNSSSKQTHSFGKQQRFPSLKPQCPQVSYGGDQVRSKNAGASIGIGKKSDFTKLPSCSPGFKYELKSNFQSNKSYKKGYYIGISRQKVKFASYISLQSVKTPPSNRYDVKQQCRKKKNLFFSMGSRTKNLDLQRTIQPINDNPGPGSYRTIQLDRKSINIHGEKRTNFGVSKSIRFPSSQNRIPGPGSYNEVSAISSVGKYTQSRHKGGTIAKILGGRRITQFDVAAKKSLQTPGAGSYKAPSQFVCPNPNNLHQKLKHIKVQLKQK